MARRRRPLASAALDQGLEDERLARQEAWHVVADPEDELFFVVAGRLRMDFRDREVWVDPGEMILVPHGVEHRPHADEEVSILLFEPAATLNTGNVVSEQTVTQLERI